MMSVILLLNGLLDILICMLLFLYTNKFRFRMSRGLVITFTCFSLYVLFVGFLRIRLACVDSTWSWIIEENQLGLFSIINLITSTIIPYFLYASLYKINLKNT